MKDKYPEYTVWEDVTDESYEGSSFYVKGKDDWVSVGRIKLDHYILEMNEAMRRYRELQNKFL